MKRVAIISLGYLWFPCEPGPSRFFQIASLFAKEGWKVTCVTTDFQHFRKQNRETEKILQNNYPFETVFIEVPPYNKNVGLQRIHSNKKAEENLRHYLEQNAASFDLVYVSIPANNLAAATAEICHAKGVPYIVDVEDLWPEAMSMVIKHDGLRNFLFRGYTRDAEKTYRYAGGIIGTSEDYTDRAFRVRPRDIPAETVYVGCDLEKFDEGVAAHRAEVEKPEGEIWVTYAGSISTSYDIGNLIDAGKLLEDTPVRIQILGSGSQESELKTKSYGQKNIRFWGYMPYPKMAAVLSASDILVNSFVKGAPQSIVNKVGDYLAAGKPIVNTLENPVFKNLIDKHEVGKNVEPGEPAELADAIRALLEDRALAGRLGKNARTLAEEKFDRARTYPSIIKLAERVAK